MNRELLVDLLARGVPWPIALEAVASSALDRDQTHSLDEVRIVADELRALGYSVTPPDAEGGGDSP